MPGSQGVRHASPLWASASPKFIMGGSDKENHPTQKPVELVRRPILNHLKRGEPGAEPPWRRPNSRDASAAGIELDPKYTDVIVIREQSLSNQKATLDGDGRSFEEITQERQKGAM